MAMSLIGLMFCGLVLLALLSVGIIGLLIKFGVIVREAQRPPHLDSGNYRLDQGREVVSEEQRK